VNALALFLYTLLFGFLRIKPATEPIDPLGKCASCGYDTAGLPPQGICPECGVSLSYRRHRRRNELHWRCPSRAMLLPASVLLIMYLLTAWPLAQSLVIRSYRALGYSPEVSLMAATKRELRSMSPDQILFPVWIVAGLSPLLGYSRRRRAAVLFLAICILAACSTAIARWFPPFARW
jgi:hypothetical protein